MWTEQRNAVLVEVGKRVRTLQQRSADSDTADTILNDLTLSASEFVPGTEYAGITVVGRKGAIETIAPTHQYVADLDEVQRRHEQGPCFSVDTRQDVLRIDDLAAEQRWPRYREEAVKLTPIRSVLSYRLFAARQHSGALNLYAAATRAFDEDSVAIGLAFATHTGLVWTLVRRSEHFQTALASRDIIGQAKGIVMERFNLDAERAFELLKKLSQKSNIPVAEIARRMIDADHPPQ